MRGLWHNGKRDSRHKKGRVGYFLLFPAPMAREKEAQKHAGDTPAAPTRG